MVSADNGNEHLVRDGTIFAIREYMDSFYVSTLR